MTARDRRDGRTFFDDVAQMSLKQDAKHRPYVVGIGSDRIDREATRVVHVVSQLVFDPDIAAAAARYIALKASNDLRPGWKGLLMLIDRMDAHVTLEGYERLTSEQQDKFKKALGPSQRLTWWVAGERVKR